MLRGLLVTAAVFAGLLWADRAIYDFVHSGFNYYTRPVPEHLQIVARVLRSLEDWGENFYIVVVGFAMWRLDRHHRSRVLVLALAAILVTIPVELVKRASGRERPDMSQGRSVWHGPSRWNDGGDFQSFPSGHTASGAAYSGTLAAFYPPLRPACIALAVGCGANRIWKERHFASDCWIGGVFGFWVGFTLPRRLRSLMDWFDRRFSMPVLPEHTS